MVRLWVWDCYPSKEDQRTAKKGYKPEDIVAKLRQMEVLQSQGMAVADAIRPIGVIEVTYYRWRKEYGGMGPIS